MKPRNFPGRVNRRRLAALARMAPASEAAARTKAKLLDPAAARAIRTKKRRSAREWV